MDNAVNLSLHHVLQHLDTPSTYVRALFVGLSSAFNTILHKHLQPKLLQVQVHSRRLPNQQEATGVLAATCLPLPPPAIEPPQGCVLSPISGLPVHN